ncbi:hypothetical protein PFMALIP_04684 [Plasmodium falciparum MaliPS096_E11]|uniref:Uncharacterized protein n=2 Tax=Plasmodium falciparum TaxID=5833 RepID=A0A024X2C8_PLAFC|nr:hypothetical protein PFMALIP_04684 [Plasmodium falciparum MaliPS096_E11]ETW59323.1 hypothetical protein PFMC_04800 [Plasmodium falciparum CAMP/Malaysia]
MNITSFSVFNKIYKKRSKKKKRKIYKLFVIKNNIEIQHLSNFIKERGDIFYLNENFVRLIKSLYFQLK